MRIIILSFFIQLSLFTSAQFNIDVVFYKNGINQKLNNNFEIVLVSNNDSTKVMLKPKIIGSTIFFYDLCEKEKYDVILKYRRKYYYLGNNNINYKQDVEWEINYEREKKIVLQIQPLEFGEGIETMIQFKSRLKYFRSGKSMVIW